MASEGNVCHNAPEATDTRRLQIEEMIAHHLECIRKLREEWNDLAPISSLPPEVLGSIFSVVLAERKPPSTSVSPWYHFTHVSRLWRSVALNTPTLWQVLPKNIGWATATLERSKGTDLRIMADSTYLWSSRLPFLKEVVLANHSSRIREIHFKLSKYYALELADLFENLPQSSLRLHSLNLTSESDREGLSFPTGVLETENLRILSVNDCIGPWYSLSLPALTNLKLHNIRNRPPLTTFLEMLRGLGTVHVLDMKNSLPLANDFVGPKDPVILPNLRHLCLSSTFDVTEVASILPLLIVPPTATLFIDEENHSSTKEEVEIILDELASSLSTFFGRVRQGTDLSYSSLRIWSDRTGHLLLKAWKDDGRISLTPDLHLNFNFSRPLTSAQDLLQRILPALSLFNITTLSLHIFPIRRLLEETFGRLSRLQNLKLMAKSTTEFVEALAHKHPEHHETEPCTILFPALQSLWIKLPNCTLQDLQNSLRERNFQLLKLKLIDCNGVWAKNVDSLREVVKDVECGRSENDDWQNWR